ncbi:MAG: hypothetical protein Q4D87_08425 [Actinomycetaceae bacterium]|nr:hypothetical protein [Actinomycetaceae bacterium]
MRDSDRPWLRKDTIYATVPGGVLISNASTGFEISGSSAYALFDKVAPLFNGTVSVGEIKASVSQNVWDLMLQIINPLAEHGFLRWIPQEDFGVLEDSVREQFSDQIAFLAQYTDQPHAAFQDFQEAEILLVGNNDQILDSLRANLTENGAGNVSTVASLDEDATGDLIIFGPTGLPSLTKAKKSRAAQMIICPAGNKIWTLPVKWSQGDVNWRSGVNSIRRATMSGQWEEAFTSATNGAPAWNHATSSPAVQRLYGSLLAYEVFKGVTGAISAETGSALFALDCLTGETEIHKITPIFESIDYKTHEDLVKDNGSAQEWDGSKAEKIPAVEFSNADSRSAEYDSVWAPLVDPITMPATAFEDLDLPQVPLKVSAVRTRWGAVRTTSPWTTADARIDGIAAAYGLALTAHAGEDGKPARTVFGVERSALGAVIRALETIANHLTLPSGTLIGEHQVPGSLGGFIDEISSNRIKLECLGEVAGFHFVRAQMDEWSYVAVAATCEQAQARAAVNVLGFEQVGAASDVDLTISQDFKNVVTDLPRIHTVELADGWFVAIVTLNGNRG